AIGGPLNRVRRVQTHASLTSGRCARRRHARRGAPATCKQLACLASAPARRTKAAKAAGTCGFMCDLPACDTVVPRDMPAGVLRRHEREPVTRQTLRIRRRTPAHLRGREYVRKHRVLRRAYSYSAD